MCFSVHTMEGDPAQLLAAKREHMDPVVARLAPRHGAVATLTVPTDSGIAVYNVWRSAEGAMAFSQEPEAQEAQRASGLPAPASFARYQDAELVVF